MRTTSTTLAAVRLAGGSATVRGLIEFSRASKGEVSASERVFKRALGLDYRFAEGVWLSLRIGKIRTQQGSDNETVSLATLAYSPKTTLP